ncbi:MAG: dihydrolipoyl dehydrogenase [Candidatus Omnitrophica bacterium]|nr:dihydrolipoyl dehydrogenase [Candidatus Omnitrophota bacterium]
MSSENQYDIAILGGGPGGYIAAIRAARHGLKTALIEKEKIGGTCLHWGCIPTKGLLQNAQVFRHCTESDSFGIRTGEVSYDWEAIMERQRGIIDRLHKGVQSLMKKHQIEVIPGFGRLASPTSLEVETQEGARIVQAKNIVVATGSVARSLPGVQLDEERVISNVGALTMKKPPKSLVVIGAGAVGVEFASIYRTFGAEVTILEYLPKLVPLEDEEVSKYLFRCFKKAKMNVQLGVAVQTVENRGDHVQVTYKKGEDLVEMEAEMCLVSVGRKPIVEGIGLENTKAKVERGVIVVNEYCQSDEPTVYAIGDVIGNYLLAHVAEVEGLLAVDHIAGKGPEPIDYSAVPRCTYCHPQIGSVGLSEKECEEQAIPIEVGKAQFMPNGKAMALGETDGFSKVIRHAETGELLGGHIIGPEATDLVMEYVVAKKNRMSAASIAHTIHPHPTLSEVNLDALHNAIGEPVHG